MLFFVHARKQICNLHANNLDTKLISNPGAFMIGLAKLPYVFRGTCIVTVPVIEIVQQCTNFGFPGQPFKS